VYDISGGLVNIADVEQKSFDKYSEITEQILKGKIDKSDIVSFDIFDTLLMRRVLYPRDIFALIEHKIGDDFYKRRINAENELYHEGKHPTINDIYGRLGNVSPDIEVEIEAKYLVRRERMFAILKYARETGKEIFAVSDMYLPRDVMKKLLDKFDVPIETGNILVSCDYGTSKSNGLFDVLRSKSGDKRILHIGDNYEADITSAKRYGIDDIFHIESALTMLEDSYASEILKYDDTLANRLLIGEFISRQLNNPFLFSGTHGKFYFGNIYEMIYQLVAPLIYCFFGWLVKKSRELRLDRILLSSRDGYILERMYQIFKSRGEELPRMQYFYTSRAAAVLAGLNDDEDIRHAARLAYAGKTKDMLKKRFGLTDGEILPGCDLDAENYALANKDAIMRRAETARMRYKAYINKFEIPAGANVGFFDFVSSGTCQKGLLNFVSFNLKGLYFAALNNETEYKSDAEIHAMFGTLNMFEKNYNITESYIFLENILTSCEPTLRGFDDNGGPLFLEESRTERQMRTVREIHRAILDYMRNTKMNLSDVTETDAAAADLLLNLLQSKLSLAETDYFDTERFSDEFCNRTFNLSDTIRREGTSMQNIQAIPAKIWEYDSDNSLIRTDFLISSIYGENDVK
jgi:FMN phosphatase YigB (HAD superfamily)